jgi:hypothetical protein
MPICPEQVRAVLSQVDPARLRSGWPVGLRDGALLALIAAGLSAEKIAGLHATSGGPDGPPEDDVGPSGSPRPGRLPRGV